jgi:hypothetical protein
MSATISSECGGGCSGKHVAHVIKGSVCACLAGEMVRSDQAQRNRGNGGSNEGGSYTDDQLGSVHYDLVSAYPDRNRCNADRASG